MMRNLNKHVRFYKWFAGCGYASFDRWPIAASTVVIRDSARLAPPRSLTLASKRGLGAHPSKIFGLFTPPTLSALQLRLAGMAFTACLLASCLPLAPRVFLCLSAMLYFLYFTQLFAECAHRIEGSGWQGGRHA